MSELQKANELKLSRRQTVLSLVIVCIALLVVGVWAGWTKIYENPSRVFWDGVANDLATVGVTRHITDSNSQGKLDEYVQIGLGGGGDVAVAYTDLTQGGSLVSTKTISTPSADYTEYTVIKAKANNNQAIPLRINNVVGVWGKSANTTASPQSTHLLNQAILGTIPTAYIPETERENLMSLAHKALNPDLAHVTTTVVDGQRSDIYNVTLLASSYARFMQQFSLDAGLGNPASFNPSNYSDNTKYTLSMAVNPISHQIVEINYGANHIEYYSGYGLPLTVELPTKTIPTSELQQRVTQL